MSLWLEISRFVVQQQNWIGLVLFGSGMLMLPLPAMIASTQHARTQPQPVPALPIWPGQHLRFVGYVFSRSTWKETTGRERSMLLLYRVAFLTAMASGLLLFAASVTLG